MNKAQFKKEFGYHRRTNTVFYIRKPPIWNGLWETYPTGGFFVQKEKDLMELCPILERLDCIKNNRKKEVTSEKQLIKIFMGLTHSNYKTLGQSTF